jgi:hypothetical protein
MPDETGVKIRWMEIGCVENIEISVSIGNGDDTPMALYINTGHFDTDHAKLFESYKETFVIINTVAQHKNLTWFTAWVGLPCDNVKKLTIEYE